MKKLIFILLLVAFAPISILAEPKLIELSAELQFKPIEASVNLISNTNSSTLNNLNFKNISGNIYAVVAQIPERYLTGEVFASAFFKSAEGKLAMSDMILVSNDASQSYLSLPVCDSSSKIEINASTAGQEGLLKSLEQIRIARRDVLKTNLKKVLSNDYQTRLSRIETGFGLGSGETITSDLAPFEILSRLERIRLSVETYQQTKSK